MLPVDVTGFLAVGSSETIGDVGVGSSRSCSLFSVEPSRGSFIRIRFGDVGCRVASRSMSGEI
jgi:hypothetical protein